MTASTVSSSTNRPGTAPQEEGGRIALLVLGSIACSLVLGVLFALFVFGGGTEGRITGGALVALGVGYVLVAALSTAFTDQGQGWAFAPGAASVGLGLALILASPSNRALELTGWLWPALLLVLVAWSFRGARRSLHSWSRRALLYPALVFLVLVAVGGAFETVADTASSNPAPGGRAYVVDGHRLYLNCVGEGAPTVILFNGLGARTPSWSWVRQDLLSTTRVCVFDRAGQGWSGSGPGRQDGHELASDLHGLLETADIPGPYVLTGHSVGGTYALVYAARYPRQVAGVALIDSSSPHQFELPDYPRFYSILRRVSALLPSLSRAGLGRLTLGTGHANLPPDARDQARAFASSPRELGADRLELRELPRVFDQAKALRSLGDRPLAVLTADRGNQRGWTELQVRLAQLSTNSTHRTIEGSTHAAMLEDERFASVVARAVVDIVRSVRSDRIR